MILLEKSTPCYKYNQKNWVWLQPPEFPALVLDTWFCRGWQSNDGTRTEKRPIVITHQLLNFGKRFGAKIITTDGIEFADIDKPPGYLNCLF